MSFFEPDSTTGCDHSEPGCPPAGYLSFALEINPSFDVFNIFIVTMCHTVQEFVGVSFENNSFLCVLIHCSADCWLFPQAICPQGATL